MNKELEALEEIRDFRYGEDKLLVCQTEMYSTIKQALQRLESIDNANPSEALEDLEQLAEMADKCWVSCDVHKWKNTIKQALIKAQENEKESAYIEKIKTMMKQKDCVLRYIESEDCFAVKTILSDGWYKLTPEFVDDNVREEIKPLPLIEKNKQLKEEFAEYKRALEIIKKKDVDISYLKNECHFELCLYNKYLIETKQLTEEEFDLLKEVLK